MTSRATQHLDTLITVIHHIARSRRPVFESRCAPKTKISQYMYAYSRIIPASSTAIILLPPVCVASRLLVIGMQCNASQDRGPTGARRVAMRVYVQCVCVVNVCIRAHMYVYVQTVRMIRVFTSHVYVIF